MANLTPPINEGDQQTGNSNAKVNLVEYGDYQCSHCGKAHPLVKQLLEEKGNDVRFVFRNFPLSQSHPFAAVAAQGAEAAGKQGKFWEMHDKIYNNQQQVDRENLDQFAESLGLDMDKFAKDIESVPVSSKVESDFESGVRSGVNGTPAFFVNGEKLETYDGNYESLEKAVAEKL